MPPSAEAPLRILVLSTHRVGDTVGGEVLLHRHIQRAPRSWTFVRHHLDGHSLRLRPWVQRLRSRSRRWERMLNAADAWMGFSVAPAPLRRVIRAEKPDLVYVIADGPLALRVGPAARSAGRPVVAQINDWYPGNLDVPVRCQAPLEERFRTFLRGCAVVLCASDEIAEAAQAPQKARVLYPVPEPQAADLPADTPAAPPRPVALFAGRFDHFLAPEMKSLLRTLRAAGAMDRFRIIGPDAGWDGETRALIAGTPVYGSLLKGAAYHRALAEASVLLLIAPFGGERAHLARYSFPCKLADYCRHRGAILVWGPPASSSVRWAERTGAAATVTTPDPAAVLAAIDRLLAHPAAAAAYAQAARREAERTFAPEPMQAVFDRAILDAAGS